MSDKEHDQKTSPRSSLAKKPYKAPEVLKWGSMRDITLSAGNKSTHPDGAKKFPNRTS